MKKIFRLFRNIGNSINSLTLRFQVLSILVLLFHRGLLVTNCLSIHWFYVFTTVLFSLLLWNLQVNNCEKSSFTKSLMSYWGSAIPSEEINIMYFSSWPGGFSYCWKMLLIQVLCRTENRLLFHCSWQICILSE